VALEPLQVNSHSTAQVHIDCIARPSLFERRTGVKDAFDIIGRPDDPFAEEESSG
jgi:hypothetical protein